MKQRLQSIKLQRSYSQVSHRHSGKTRRKRNLAFAATGSVAFGTLLVSTDPRHYYEAAERSGRVVTTLYACINEYDTPF